MAIKVILTIAILIINSINVSASAEEVGTRYTEEQNFKNYALAACLGDGFASVKAEAAHAEHHYLQMMQYPIEAFQAANELGLVYLEKKYSKERGKKLTIMKCIDFSNSKELDAIIKKYSRK
jgi:hypothetical protein